MSKLFDAMQNANTRSAELLTGSEALVRLLDSVDGAKAVGETGATPQNGYRHLELRVMQRPFLLAGDETNATHGAFEAYRALRTKLVRFQSRQGVRSVVISSAEAGEGKTVSAVNLGLCMAQLSGQRVLLVDADLRSSGLSKATGAMETPGLAEVLSGQAPFDKAVVATNIPNLYIVGAGDAKRPAGDLFAGPTFREFMGWCNEVFSMVLVDCPPMMGLADFEVLSTACDGVLLVVRAQRTKRQRLADLVPLLRDKKLLGLVLNGQERQHHKSRPYYYGGNGGSAHRRRA